MGYFLLYRIVNVIKVKFNLHLNNKRYLFSNSRVNVSVNNSKPHSIQINSAEVK